MAEEKLLSPEELEKLSAAEIEKLITDRFAENVEHLGENKIVYQPVPKEYLAAFKSAQEREARLKKERIELDAAERENPFAPPRK